MLVVDEVRVRAACAHHIEGSVAHLLLEAELRHELLQLLPSDLADLVLVQAAEGLARLLVLLPSLRGEDLDELPEVALHPPLSRPHAIGYAQGSAAQHLRATGRDRWLLGRRLVARLNVGPDDALHLVELHLPAALHVQGLEEAIGVFLLHVEASEEATNLGLVDVPLIDVQVFEALVDTPVAHGGLRTNEVAQPLERGICLRHRLLRQRLRRRRPPHRCRARRLRPLRRLCQQRLHSGGGVGREGVVGGGRGAGNEAGPGTHRPPRGWPAPLEGRGRPTGSGARPRGGGGGPRASSRERAAADDLQSLREPPRARPG
mmetsp:Transcript_38779/g.111354  ORF Transcript_38779/g.111354 Transcript_38779/m.111354 type:complete len:318 (-) Transcript_38779:103-1056(-)